VEKYKHARDLPDTRSLKSRDPQRRIVVSYACNKARDDAIRRDPSVAREVSSSNFTACQKRNALLTSPDVLSRGALNYHTYRPRWGDVGHRRPTLPNPLRVRRSSYGNSTTTVSYKICTHFCGKRGQSHAWGGAEEGARERIISGDLPNAA